MPSSTPLIAFLFLLVVASALPRPAHSQTSDQPCTYDEACGSGMCKVWERSRFVCEPKQYSVAVWDRNCLEKIELAQDSHMEAPIADDGKPDMKKARIVKTPVTLSKGCQWRYEVRER